MTSAHTTPAREPWGTAKSVPRGSLSPSLLRSTGLQVGELSNAATEQATSQWCLGDWLKAMAQQDLHQKRPLHWSFPNLNIKFTKVMFEDGSSTSPDFAFMQEWLLQPRACGVPSPMSPKPSF